jgi:hypothetical protein
MSIQIVDNFKLNLAVPIDSRMVTTGQISRNSIKYVYEGLRVYDITEKTPYVWIDGSWKIEISTGVSGSSGGSSGGISIPTGTTNRILKYITNTTIGDSSIIDKGTYPNSNVGIGMQPLTGIALSVMGIINANSFIGAIKGTYLDTSSISLLKIKPHTITTGEFGLKTLGGQVQWSSINELNTDIVIANKTSDTSTHYLLFSSISNSTTGTKIYSNYDTSRLIGVKPLTSQILASGDNINNNKTTPGYSFSGKTDSGLYGSSVEVGLSFGGNSLLKLNSTNLSIFDIAGNEVLKTGTGKIICNTGTFSSTINVSSGTTTLNDLIVSTGTNTFTIINTTTINVKGQANILNLFITTPTTTTFNSLNVSELTVTTKLNTLDLKTTSTTQFKSLRVTNLNVLNPNDSNLKVLNVYGNSSLVSSFSNPIRSKTFDDDINQYVSTPLIINAPISGTGETLSVFTLRFGANSGGGYISESLGSARLKKGVEVKSMIPNQQPYSNTSNGLVTCSKVRFEKTNISIMNTIIDPNTRQPYNTPASYVGYKAGDVIWCEWLQETLTGIWDEANSIRKNVPSIYVGSHYFFTGPKYGWRVACNTSTSTITDSSTGTSVLTKYGVLQKIDPNPAPYPPIVPAGTPSPSPSPSPGQATPPGQAPPWKIDPSIVNPWNPGTDPGMAPDGNDQVSPSFPTYDPSVDPGRGGGGPGYEIL